MLEGLASDIISHYIGTYIDFNPESLKVGIWRGDAELVGTALRTDAFDAFDLPVTVKWGQIGRIHLKVPWSSLRSEPVIITLRDIFAVVTPRSVSNVSGNTAKTLETERKNSEQRSKQRRLNEWERNRTLKNLEKQSKTSGSSSKSSFTSRLLTKIIDNIQISVENVHIRYEDPSTMTSFSSEIAVSDMICAGVTVAHLSACSCDENFAPSFVNRETTHTGVHKLAKVSDLALYWETDGKPLMPPLPTGSGKEYVDANWRVTQLKKLMIRSNSNTTNELLKDCIIKPINATMKLHSRPLNQVSGTNPKYSADLDIVPVEIALYANQFFQIEILLDHFKRQQEIYKHRANRPASSPILEPISWWKFSIGEVIADIRRRREKWQWQYMNMHYQSFRRYIREYKGIIVGNLMKPGTQKSKKTSPKDTTDAERRSIVESLEKLLDFETIAMCRKIAEAEVSFWQRNESSSIGFSEEDRRKLYAAIDHDISSLDINNNDFVIISASFHLASMRASFLGGSVLKHMNPKSRKIAEIEAGSISFGFRKKPKQYIIQASLEYLVVSDLATEDSLFPIVMSATQQSDTTPKTSSDEPLFSLEYERNPANSDYDARMKINTQPLVVVFSRDFIDTISAFFSRNTRILLTELEAVASHNLDNLLKRMKSESEYTARKRNIVDLEIDIHTPSIVIPQNVRKIGSEVLVLDLGHFLLTTKASNIDDIGMKDVSDSNSEHDGIEESIYFDARPPAEMIRNNEDNLNNGDKISKYVDRYNASLKHVLAYLARAEGHNQQLSNVTKVVNPFGIQLNLEVSATLAYHRPRLRTHGNLDEIYLRLTPSGLARLSAVAESIVPTPHRTVEQSSLINRPTSRSRLHSTISTASSRRERKYSQPKETDNDLVNVKCRRMLVETEFSLKRVQIALFDSSTDEPNALPMVKLVADGFNVMSISRPYDYCMKLQLDSLNISEHLTKSENDENIFGRCVVSSTDDLHPMQARVPALKASKCPSTLINIYIYHVSDNAPKEVVRDYPLHTVYDTGTLKLSPKIAEDSNYTYITAYFGKLSILWHMEVIASIIESTKKAVTVWQSINTSRETIVEGKVLADVKSSPRMHISANLESLLFVLSHNWRDHVASIWFDSSDLVWDWTSDESSPILDGALFSMAGRVKSLSVEDLTQQGQVLYPVVLSVAPNRELLSFKYTISAEGKSLHPNNVQGTTGRSMLIGVHGVHVTYTQRFIDSLMAFIQAEPLLLELATKTIDLAETQANQMVLMAQYFTSISLHANDTSIVLPRNSFSTECLLLSLKQLALKSTLKLPKISNEKSNITSDSKYRSAIRISHVPHSHIDIRSDGLSLCTAFMDPPHKDDSTRCSGAYEMYRRQGCASKSASLLLPNLKVSGSPLLEEIPAHVIVRLPFLELVDLNAYTEVIKTSDIRIFNYEVIGEIPRREVSMTLADWQFAIFYHVISENFSESSQNVESETDSKPLDVLIAIRAPEMKFSLTYTAPVSEAVELVPLAELFITGIFVEILLRRTQIMVNFSAKSTCISSDRDTHGIVPHAETMTVLCPLHNVNNNEASKEVTQKPHFLLMYRKRNGLPAHFDINLNETFALMSWPVLSALLDFFALPDKLKAMEENEEVISDVVAEKRLQGTATIHFADAELYIYEMCDDTTHTKPRAFSLQTETRMEVSWYSNGSVAFGALLKDTKGMISYPGPTSSNAGISTDEVASHVVIAPTKVDLRFNLDPQSQETPYGWRMHITFDESLECQISRHDFGVLSKVVDSLLFKFQVSEKCSLSSLNLMRSIVASQPELKSMPKRNEISEGFSVTVVCSLARIIMLSTANGRNSPFMSAVVEGIGANWSGSPNRDLITGSAQCRVSFHNERVLAWEPLIEQFNLQLSVQRFGQKSDKKSQGAKIDAAIRSDGAVNVNVSSDFVRKSIDLMSSDMGNQESPEFQKSSREPFISLSLVNECGTDVRFSQSYSEPVLLEESTTYGEEVMTLETGKSIPLVAGFPVTDRGVVSDSSSASDTQLWLQLLETEERAASNWLRVDPGYIGTVRYPFSVPSKMDTQKMGRGNVTTDRHVTFNNIAKPHTTKGPSLICRVELTDKGRVVRLQSGVEIYSHIDMDVGILLLNSSSSKVPLSSLKSMKPDTLLFLPAGGKVALPITTPVQSTVVVGPPLHPMSGESTSKPLFDWSTSRPSVIDFFNAKWRGVASMPFRFVWQSEPHTDLPRLSARHAPPPPKRQLAIRLCPILVLKNHLPYAVEVQILCEASITKVAGRLKPVATLFASPTPSKQYNPGLRVVFQSVLSSGSTANVHTVNPAQRCYFRCKIPQAGYGWMRRPCLIYGIVEEEMEANSVFLHTMENHDMFCANGAELTPGRLKLNLNIQKLQNSICSVSLEAPYWIVNCTGIPLAFREASQGTLMGAQAIPLSLGPPPDPLRPLLYSSEEQNGILELKTENSEWSSPLDHSIIGSSGSIMLRSNAEGERRARKLHEFCIEVAQHPDSHIKTRLIKYICSTVQISIFHAISKTLRVET